MGTPVRLGPQWKAVGGAVRTERPCGLAVPREGRAGALLAGGRCCEADAHTRGEGQPGSQDAHRSQEPLDRPQHMGFGVPRAL